MDGVRRRNIQLFLSKQSQIINPVQLNDLLKALERFGVKLPALPWRSLGERLGLEKGTLDDIESYFTALKTVMDMMDQRVCEDEYIDCLRECLFVWLDRNDDRATLSFLISALYSLTEETSEDSVGILLAVESMIGT
ncbi:PREDICTED: uncharacterized protein LOC109585089 [Amphimedon queenslandica]|uniref:Death domain-containing protein n=1 Tax=Amphimedon queenslandica TaxID=400682 RepID=A0AAN0JIG2_AMPQE|nr:PREDICTED: uncharacterized protein LOC109585089 [Amphimedon queenslandica]|eukprot:XP_019856591.1 PREDICTED: uncharacterized protein LOC109585089 [Amphimedon queenslandica]